MTEEIKVVLYATAENRILTKCSCNGVPLGGTVCGIPKTAINEEVILFEGERKRKDRCFWFMPERNNHCGNPKAQGEVRK